jgi:hypothetical protein
VLHLARKVDLRSYVLLAIVRCVQTAKKCISFFQVATWLAITFHQLFEGMGLGARIARLEWHSNGALKKFFNLTTPLGMGIVSGIQQVCNCNSNLMCS